MLKRFGDCRKVLSNILRGVRYFAHSESPVESLSDAAIVFYKAEWREVHPFRVPPDHDVCRTSDYDSSAP